MKKEKGKKEDMFNSIGWWKRNWPNFSVMILSAQMMEEETNFDSYLCIIRFPVPPQ